MDITALNSLIELSIFYAGATSIHHGPPGSYKSFTLVQRFAIPALIEGRTVVTNIRGFDNVDRVIQQFPDKEFSPNARIIWVDTTTQAGRTRMAKWFHWVPFGALVIIDEVQQVYPDRRDFKLESLDTFTPYPGEIIEDIGLKEGRPEDVFTAYDKQRHYNWDIFCSTPNIAKVKKEIREVSEWAYRHRDLSGLLPWKKNTWIEHQHDPETSGKSPSHRVGTPVQYKADPRVFACYASTATGQHVQSKAGRSILSDPKIMGVLVLIVACLVAMVYFYSKRFDTKKDTQPTATVPQAAPDPRLNLAAGRPDAGVSASVSHPDDSALKSNLPVNDTDYIEKYLTQYRPRLIGLVESKKLNKMVAWIEFTDDSHHVFERLNIPQIVAFGYIVERKPYGLLLRRGEKRYPVTAWPLDLKNKMPNEQPGPGYSHQASKELQQASLPAFIESGSSYSSNSEQ